MLLQFTDGTTTVSFSYAITGHLLRRYTPQTPDYEYVDSRSTLIDGGELPVSTFRDVTETVEVAWTGTLAQQRTAVQSLNRLFHQARHRQRTGMGDRVWVQLQPIADETAWESEVFSGRVLMDDTYRAGLQIAAEQVLSQIVFTRRYYWEGAEDTLPLANYNGSDVTDGLTVYNTTDDDGEYEARLNYVDILGTDVEGDLPTPLILELENTYNETADLSWVWIAANIRSNPSDLSHHLEGEDATGGTTSNVATASSGSYQTFTTALDSQVAIFDWTLTSNMLTDCAGNWFQIMWRSTEDLRYIWFEWELHAGSTTVWKSDEFQVDRSVATAIRAAGAVRLPPWLPGLESSVELGLKLYGRKTGGFTCAIDFLELWALDSYAVLFGSSGYVPYGDTLVYDGIEKTTYVSGTTGNAGTFTAYAGPIMVEPGKDERLYFLQHANQADLAEVDRTMKVVAKYRPRRLCL
jgi:hypothetical protein